MRVLVVEDEHTVAEAIRRGLTAEGFAVDVANDGADGLQRALDTDFDAIVLDIKLPVLNGYQVLKQLREQDRWAPVLMLTAKDGEYDVADALDLGADDYLTKPFSFVVLVARLHAMMRRGAPERPARITAGALEVDPATRHVTSDGVRIPLTTREFAVLEYLARNAGVVVSKTSLLEHVWDENFEGDHNIVEVYVGYLRRKVGAEAIETVRGAGYRLRA